MHATYCCVDRNKKCCYSISTMISFIHIVLKCFVFLHTQIDYPKDSDMMQVFDCQKPLKNKYGQ